jgi:hypothetical protein
MTNEAGKEGTGKRRKENVHVRQGGQVFRRYAGCINGKATMSIGNHGGKKATKARK